MCHLLKGCSPDSVGVGRIVHCSFLATEQRDSLECPVVSWFHCRAIVSATVLPIACVSWLRWLRLQINFGDQVLVVALWHFVDRAVVVGLLNVCLVVSSTSLQASLLWRCSRDRSHVQNGELEVQVLACLFLEALTLLGPLGSLEIESVNEHALLLWLKLSFHTAIVSLNDFFLRSELGLHLVKRPLLVRVLAGDFLQNSCQETLRVVETSQPEAGRSCLVDSVQPVG